MALLVDLLSVNSLKLLLKRGASVPTVCAKVNAANALLQVLLDPLLLVLEV